jgi:hypothetical protein
LATVRSRELARSRSTSVFNSLNAQNPNYHNIRIADESLTQLVNLLTSIKPNQSVFELMCRGFLYAQAKSSPISIKIIANAARQHFITSLTLIVPQRKE